MIKKTVVDDSIRMPNGKPSGMHSIGAGWGGVMPKKKTVKVKVTPKVKFKMNPKGVMIMKK
jgi:hypothetical protein